MDLLNIDNYKWTKDKNGKDIPILKLPKEKKKKVVGKKRKPRQRKIIRSYKTYMTSNLWTDRKNRYWKKYGKKCELCGKTSWVTLHHKEYNNNYGDEPDRELIALCASCHKTFHDNYETKRNMQKETNEFIKSMKPIIGSIKEIDERFYQMFK